MARATHNETVAIPSCEFVDETFAASIFEWDMQRLYYMQSFNSFPIPIRCGQMLVVRTADIARWALNRRYGITRYSI
ncbi:hypothetical protein MESS2_350084 [Mesorhizobium metallidurans STM 2683]|uniref:Uncharacterized protein n=1 Tax=Mesorhizobium metallidurans STM 2683 TaxID=1297569 RepID=M5EQX3_9HYPH|nr:hypothetical protein MESS2_350084 [Mesorhizobium metallidurans STM 2683]